MADRKPFASNDDADRLDLALVANLGAAASGVSEIDITTEGLGKGLPPIVPLVFSHSDGRLLDLRQHIEAFRLRPHAKAGTATALTVDAFIALVNRHKTEHSVVFADTSWTRPSFTAVIDYHHTADAEPDNLRHRVGYAFPLSDEWQLWLKGNRQKMSQVDFAAFLEDRVADLASPFETEKTELERLFQTKIAAPNELITFSRGLEVMVEAKVKNVVTLQSGESQIVYDEVHKDAQGNKVIVPGLFMLRIPIFFMGEPVRVPVRLRYRASGGDITWFYDIYRPDTFVTERIREDLRIVGTETELPTFEGTPESGR
jgi:hypothetical protein